MIALVTALALIGSGVAAYWIDRSPSHGLLGAWQSVLLNVFVALAGGAISAGVLLAVYIWLFARQEQALSAAICVDPKTTLALHRADLDATDSWTHDGHIGRWVRTEAIPALTRRASRLGQTLNITLAILDPNDIDLCEQYVAYRRLISYRGDVIRNEADALIEILATVVVGAIANVGPSLDVRIAFRSTMTMTRVDISDRHVFRTLVDPRAPAVVYTRGDDNKSGPFYEATRRGFLLRFAAMREIPLAWPGATDDLSDETFREFFTVSQLRFHDTEPFLQDLRARIRSDFTPYG